MFRVSTSSDLNDIKSLVFKCYGAIDLKGGLDDLDGEYMLHVMDSGKVTGIVGLYWFDEYMGNTVSLPCVHSVWRDSCMLEIMFTALVEESGRPLYCECWSGGGDDVGNMVSLLTSLGFVRVVQGVRTYRRGFNCYKCSESCNRFLDGECTCCVDLYALLN